MGKWEKVKKGIYYEGRPTKQFLQHLGGFCLATQCTPVEKGEDRYLYSQTQLGLITERAKLLFFIKNDDAGCFLEIYIKIVTMCNCL